MARVAVVTGAARGIGHQVATRLAGDGYSLVLIDSDDKTLNRVCAELREGGVDAVGSVSDISVEREVTASFDVVRDHFGRLDVCVSNAGISPKDTEGRPTPTAQMLEEEWSRVLAVNLTGAFLTAREATRIMIDRPGDRSLVFIASLASRKYVDVVGAHYHATKSGVLGLARCLAGELAVRGIRVNSVAPGRIRTPMTNEVPDEVNDRFLASVPLGSWGEPDDVAAAVAYLASDDARYVTGAVLDVNGGAWMG